MWNRSIIIHLHLIQMRFAGIMVDNIFRASINVYSIKKAIFFSITIINLLSAFRCQQWSKDYNNNNFKFNNYFKYAL